MSKTNNVIPEFKAIFNPFTRNLLVKYGDVISEHFFEDIEEWTKISYEGDENHPNYLHVQLDYDENLQLLFYPRVDGCDSLNEELGSYYHYGEEIPDNIKLVYNDKEMEETEKKFLFD